jgi:hypothetical protein
MSCCLEKPSEVDDLLCLEKPSKEGINFCAFEKGWQRFVQKER